MWVKTRYTAGGWDGILSMVEVDWDIQQWRIRWMNSGELMCVLIFLHSQWLNLVVSNEQSKLTQQDMHDDWLRNFIYLLFVSSFLFDRFLVATTTTRYLIEIPPGSISDEWLHVALVYFGPNGGTSLHFNGSLVASELVGSKYNGISGSTNGSVILGRDKTIVNRHYADVTVDELYFWNEPLGAAVIHELSELSWEQTQNHNKNAQSGQWHHCSEAAGTHLESGRARPGPLFIFSVLSPMSKFHGCRRFQLMQGLRWW